MHGTMKMTIALAGLQPPTSATMSVTAQGIGTSMQVTSKLDISPEDSGSHLAWSAKIEQLKGLISAVSPGLITAAANQVIQHAWRGCASNWASNAPAIGASASAASTVRRRRQRERGRSFSQRWRIYSRSNSWVD